MIRFSICTAVTLTFALAGCGGKTADLHKLPAASPQSPELTQDFPAVIHLSGCTGTFVSTRAVLTASHCVKGDRPYTLRTPKGTFTTTQKLQLGPGREGDTKDIAILIFQLPIVNVGEILPLGKSISVGEKTTLVGFGCGGFTQTHGGNSKRSGTNFVYRLGDYIELLTPFAKPQVSSRRILGPQNRAGSCFGDSGGPLLKEENGTWQVVGVDHAIVNEDKGQISEYIDLTQGEPKDFIERTNLRYGLQIPGL